MDNKPDFCTKTMAKLYASQKYYLNAIDICKYLVNHGEKDNEILMLLSESEEKAADTDKTKNDKLHNLFENWIDLALKYNKLKKLQSFHKELAN